MMTLDKWVEMNCPRLREEIKAHIWMNKRELYFCVMTSIYKYLEPMSQPLNEYELDRWVAYYCPGLGKEIDCHIKNSPDEETLLRFIMLSIREL